MSLLNLLEEFIMFEKIRKMKNKKGFTLVELIVVLVILAILAALLIPARPATPTRPSARRSLLECPYGSRIIQTESTSIYERRAKLRRLT